MIGWVCAAQNLEGLRTGFPTIFGFLQPSFIGSWAGKDKQTIDMGSRDVSSSVCPLIAPCLAARRPLGVHLRAHPAVASHTSYVGQPWDNFSLVTGLPSCCTLQELDHWCYCEGLPTACTQGWAQDLDLSLHSLDTCPFVRGKLKAPRCLCSVGPLPTSRPKGSS